MTTQTENDTDQEVLNIGSQDDASGDAEDRGDDFTPTPEPAPAPAVGGEGGGGGTDGSTVATSEGDDDGAEGEGGRASPGIPKGRFNEVNEARKAAEARADAAEQENARLRAASAAPSPAPTPVASPASAPAAAEFDADAKEQEYMAALLDGDITKAAKVRREINNNLVLEATRQAEVQLNQRDAERQVSRVVADSIAAHPWLDRPEGAEAVEMISALRDRYINQGKPVHQALADAVAKIAPKYAPVATAGADTPSRDLPDAAKLQDTRVAKAVSRGAADSVAQAPTLQAGIGNRATAARIDVEALTDEQFAELPAAEKKRLRGD